MSYKSEKSLVAYYKRKLSTIEKNKKLLEKIKRFYPRVVMDDFSANIPHFRLIASKKDKSLGDAYWETFELEYDGSPHFAIKRVMYFRFDNKNIKIYKDDVSGVPIAHTNHLKDDLIEVVFDRVLLRNMEQATCFNEVCSNMIKTINEARARFSGTITFVNLPPKVEKLLNFG